MEDKKESICVSVIRSFKEMDRPERALQGTHSSGRSEGGLRRIRGVGAGDSNLPFTIGPAEDDTSPTPHRVSPLVPSSPVSPVFPLPPPLTASSSAPPPLVPFSPSSSPTPKYVDPLQCFRPPAPPKPEDPLAPPPASEPNTPPQPVDASSTPWLLPPSAPPEAFSLTTPPGSLVPQAPPWSDVVLPAPSVPPGFAFVLCPTASASDFRFPCSTSDARRPGSTWVSSSSSVVWALRHARSTWVSISSGVSIGRPQGGASQVSTMVPPTSTSPWVLVMVGLWTNI
ncbi:hypothetical protein DPX16_13474 [Anabarilius grahami]|uniref:Uncharacterized protein n=1 Tax=Anabarilius grahami TaxID=495550 RepID=A0A3N0YUD6_ANAGA|nr:hypothetical protein DPX16_13474 [Anabarilius grahami]